MMLSPAYGRTLNLCRDSGSRIECPTPQNQLSLLELPIDVLARVIAGSGPAELSSLSMTSKTFRGHMAAGLREETLNIMAGYFARKILDPILVSRAYEAEVSRQSLLTKLWRGFMHNPGLLEFRFRLRAEASKAHTDVAEFLDRRKELRLPNFGLKDRLDTWVMKTTKISDVEWGEKKSSALSELIRTENIRNQRN